MWTLFYFSCVLQYKPVIALFLHCRLNVSCYTYTYPPFFLSLSNVLLLISSKVLFLSPQFLTAPLINLPNCSVPQFLFSVVLNCLNIQVHIKGGQHLLRTGYNKCLNNGKRQLVCSSWKLWNREVKNYSLETPRLCFCVCVTSQRWQTDISHKVMVTDPLIKWGGWAVMSASSSQVTNRGCFIMPVTQCADHHRCSNTHASAT